MPQKALFLKKIRVLLVALLLFPFFASSVNATYTSASLSPNSGTIRGTETAVELKVNSGSDEFIGIDIYISYTGPVEYVRATGTKCSSFQAVKKSGQSINIECFSFDGDAYNGTVATLYFKSTGEGTSTFSITSADPATTNMTGGIYTLTTLSAGTGDRGTGDGGRGGGSDLPQTALSDNIAFIVGGLLILGGFLYYTFDFSKLSFYKLNFSKQISSTRKRNFEKRFYK